MKEHAVRDGMFCHCLEVLYIILEYHFCLTVEQNKRVYKETLAHNATRYCLPRSKLTYGKG